MAVVAEFWKEPLLLHNEAFLQEVETGVLWKETTTCPNDQQDDHDHDHDDDDEEMENPTEAASFCRGRSLLRAVESTACCCYQEYDGLVMYLILPTMLFVQFTVALVSWEQQPERPTTTKEGFLTVGGLALLLTWSNVSWNLALLVWSSHLYRHSLLDEMMMMPAGIQHTTGVLLLLPEMLMDAILTMLLWQGLVAGYITLWLCTLSLGGLVAMLKIYHLIVLIPSLSTTRSSSPGEPPDIEEFKVVAMPHSPSSGWSSSSSTPDEELEEV